MSSKEKKRKTDILDTDRLLNRQGHNKKEGRSYIIMGEMRPDFVRLIWTGIVCRGFSDS